MFRSLRIWAFALLGLGVVAGAEMSQAIAEGFLVPHEEQMHGMVNQHRAGKGLPGLGNNDALRMIARRQTQAMAVQGFIFHSKDLAQQASAASLPWLALGENVGIGPTVDAVQQAFLNSPSHLQNIVDSRFNTLGVGSTSDSRGALFFTQTFGALRSQAAVVPAPASRAPAPAPVRPAPARPAPVAVQGAQTTPAPAPAATARLTPEPASADPDRTVRAHLDRSRRELLVDPSKDAEAIFSRNDSITSNDRSSGRPSLVGGLVAMLQHAVAKLAFWQ